MIYDAIIVGGGYAGLSAASMLARARRDILVVDAGCGRNRFASHAHGVLALDGEPGADIVARASAQLADYSSAEQTRGSVASIDGHDRAFLVRTEDGRAFASRKILLATGVTDLLPDLSGLSERWGRSVLHCPYCHGYEIGGGPVGVLATAGGSAAQALTVADWGEVTFFAGPRELSEDQRNTLERRGVRLEARVVTAIDGDLDGPLRVRLDGGAEVRVKALFVLSHHKPSPLVSALDCALDETPHGPLIRTDANKLTSVHGVYAAGDTARLPSNITLAAADGVLAGAAIHAALIADAVERAV